MWLLLIPKAKTSKPDKKEEVSDLFLNFVRDYKLQRAYIDSTFEIDGTIVKKEDFKELSFGYTSVQSSMSLQYGLPCNHHHLLVNNCACHRIDPVMHIEND